MIFLGGRGGQSLLPLFRFMKRWKDGENRYASYHQNPSKEQVKTMFAGIDADILVKTHMKPLERAILIIKAKMR